MRGGKESCGHAGMAYRRPSLNWDQRAMIPQLGNEAAAPAVVAVAKPLLGALASDSNDHSSYLQFNEVLLSRDA